MNAKSEVQKEIKSPQSGVVDVNHDIHSDEINDIIKRVPSWIVRWGILIFLAILISTLAVCFLVDYPEMYSGKIQLVAKSPVIEIYSPAGGVVSDLILKKKGFVKKGQPILTISVQRSGSQDTVFATSDGILAFTSLIEDGIQIKRNQLLFRIHQKNEQFFGLMMLPVDNIFHIKLGQQVLIHSSKQQQKVATVLGEVSYISDEPDLSNQYTVKISLPKNVRTPTPNTEAKIIIGSSTLGAKMLNSIRMKIK